MVKVASKHSRRHRSLLCFGPHDRGEMTADEVDRSIRRGEILSEHSLPAAARARVERAREEESRATRGFLIMAIAPTATDMPQNELHENNNLEAARA